MTEEQAMRVLRRAAEVETQKRLASRLGITPAYLCDVLHGRRDPAHILRRFGYERVVSYRLATPADEGEHHE